MTGPQVSQIECSVPDALDHSVMEADHMIKAKFEQENKTRSISPCYGTEHFIPGMTFLIESIGISYVTLELNPTHTCHLSMRPWPSSLSWCA